MFNLSVYMRVCVPIYSTTAAAAKNRVNLWQQITIEGKWMWEGVKLSWVITTSEKELVEQKVAVMLTQGLPWFPMVMEMG